MKKSKWIGQMLRLLITLAGAGIGAIAATMARPFLQNAYPDFFSTPSSLLFLYITLCLIGGVVLFAFSHTIKEHLMHLSATIENRWSSMPTRQILLSAIGLILGLVVAALIHLLILSAGSSLLTVSISAIVYVVLGTMGMRIGYRRYSSKPFSIRGRKHRNALDIILDETMTDDEEEDEPDEPQAIPAPAAIPAKVLDTSVLIDGRILDIAATGFVEGDLVVAEFVLDELRHIADSADSLKRTRGRRGLDIVKQLQNQLGDRVVLHSPQEADDSEVDVRLLKLCRTLGGVIVTNDYNLNKVARISGVKALNINDLANALKPMLASGEEIGVEIVREGKEAGQGVAYLDDGTMIVVDHAKPLVGQKVDVVVTTVLQTSAGRMIFANVKDNPTGKDN
ncbi:MAG TPA: TRAM domain-containing protein [Candidatus Limiplasma sp.]|nr:TRAM domain-containing protein [Candidatus Limiplasma sp.]